MEKNFKPIISVATILDYPVIQNMARFYVYDMSKSCGYISSSWALAQDGLYECYDLKKYFVESTRKAYLVKIQDELAGFILLDKTATAANTVWNMGEFFIFGKFQGKGIAQNVAKEIFNKYSGKWEVSVIPENKKALNFWRRLIADFTKEQYTEEIKIVNYDKDQPKRYIFEFIVNN